MKKDVIIFTIIIAVVIIVGFFGTQWIKLKYQTRLETMKARESTPAVTEPSPISFVQYDGNEFSISYPSTWNKARGEDVYEVYFIGPPEKGEPKVTVVRAGDKLGISLDDYIPIFLARLRVSIPTLEIITERKIMDGISGYDFELAYYDETKETTPKIHGFYRIILHPVNSAPYAVIGIVEDTFWSQYKDTLHSILLSFKPK